MTLGLLVRPTVQEMELLASGDGTGSTITVPGTIQAGDVCVISNFGHNSGAGGQPASALPSGFTAYQNTSGTDGIGGGVRHCLAYKLLDGTETTLTGISATEMAWIAGVWRPVVPIVSIVQGQAVVGASTGGDPASVTITAGSASPLPALLIGGMTSTGAISPRSVSPAMNELSVNTKHYFHWKVYNPGDTRADHTYDMDDEGLRNIMGCGYLTFTW